MELREGMIYVQINDICESAGVEDPACRFLFFLKTLCNICLHISNTMVE